MKKALLKKLWILLTIIIIALIVVIIIIITIIILNIYNNKTQSIDKSATDYVESIGKSGSSDNDSYKEQTKLTLELYKKIQFGMTEEEVTAILGEGTQVESEVSRIIEYGNETISSSPYYWLQIVYIDNKVIGMSQAGLQ